VQRTRDGQAQVRYSVAGRSGGRVRSVLCTRRRGAHVTWLSLKTKVDRFFGLGIKTDSCGLVIWVSKSSRQFLAWDLKTRLSMVCWLCHKTDGKRTAWDTRRDLAACFTAKQVGLGFSSLPQNWSMRDGGWCTWHHRGGHVKMKSKTVPSMR
jgi:hypothetical protein